MDVTASRTIKASPTKVAEVMFDPRCDPQWIGGARSVDPPTGDATLVGAQTTRHGGFMGKRFSWTTQVARFEPERLLVMDFMAGPMKGGSVTYRIEPQGGGSRVTIHNTGPGPGLLGWFVKRSVGKDLNRLANLVER